MQTERGQCRLVTAGAHGPAEQSQQEVPKDLWAVPTSTSTTAQKKVDYEICHTENPTACTGALCRARWQTFLARIDFQSNLGST